MRRIARTPDGRTPVVEQVVSETLSDPRPPVTWQLFPAPDRLPAGGKVKPPQRIGRSPQDAPVRVQ